MSAYEPKSHKIIFSHTYFERPPPIDDMKSKYISNINWNYGKLVHLMKLTFFGVCSSIAVNFDHHSPIICRPLAVQHFHVYDRDNLRSNSRQLRLA